MLYGLMVAYMKYATAINTPCVSDTVQEFVVVVVGGVRLATYMSSELH